MTRTFRKAKKRLSDAAKSVKESITTSFNKGKKSTKDQSTETTDSAGQMNEMKPNNQIIGEKANLSKGDSESNFDVNKLPSNDSPKQMENRGAGISSSSKEPLNLEKERQENASKIHSNLSATSEKNVS